ncbi:MAG: DUF6494 family protein [Planctomycetota bacterium]|jgi:hypothetical protein
MDESTFNMSVRTFLKEVGVTSQREIEKAVRAAVASGAVSGEGRVTARVTLTIDAVDLTHVVEGDIALA